MAHKWFTVNLKTEKGTDLRVEVHARNLPNAERQARKRVGAWLRRRTI